MSSTPRRRPLRSAGTAFRADVVARHGDEFSDAAGGWVAVSTLLAHGAIDDARALAMSMLDPAVVARGCIPDPDDGSAGSPTSVLRLVAEQAEDAGALHLAASILDAYLSVDPDLTAIDQGRVIAQRARIAWKQGDSDYAEAQYREVERLGRRSAQPELRARAWIGYTALAHVRGNYPRMKYWAARALRLARANEWLHLQALARKSLMVVSAMGGDYDAALVHAWAAFTASTGDPIGQAGTLLGLSQLLLDIGSPEAARGGFASILSEAGPARIVLPALGGFAMSNAALGNPVPVRWAAEQAVAGARAGHQYPAAAVLCECARALASIGDVAEARRLRDDALTIARARGYHEIVFRAEAIDVDHGPASTTPARPLSVRAERVASNVARLYPAELPRRLEFSEVSG
jgi:hypothetical protein